MLMSDYVEKVKVGQTFIVCPKRSPRMPEGWNEFMDALVGVPLLVIKKNTKSVTIETDTGEEYMFGYKYIQIYNNNYGREEVYLEETKLLISDSVNIYAIEELALNSDVRELYKVVGKKLVDSKFQVTTELLKTIQDKCPRIIGVMMSNNILTRAIK